MSHLDQLMEAEEASRSDHIYLVSFQILTALEQLEEDGWVDDELTVACGPDAKVAIAKVASHVVDQEAYGLPVKDFRVRGVKLLAEADI